MLLFSMLFSIHSMEGLHQHFALSQDDKTINNLSVQMQELPTEDLCKTSPAAEKDAPEAIVLNWFEQFWTTGWLWTNALNLSKNDRSTSKWSGLSVETVQHHFDCASFPSQLSRCMLRWWRQKYQRRQRPNTSQNNACFFLKVSFMTRSCSFERLWLT